ncbi:MAG: hypothetical protein ACR2MO_00550 [Acidimicrobiales bacterium]
MVAHRVSQHGGGAGHEALVAAVADLYAFVYGAPLDSVRPAAAERAGAMRISDRWVAEGCDLASPLVVAERAALVRLYAALLAVVHHPAVTAPRR